MKLKKASLALTEDPDVDSSRYLYAHPLQGWLVSDRGDDQISGIFESDEPAVEQVVNARCQQQAILTIQSLFVGRVAPGLAVAGEKVTDIIDPRDAATPLDSHHALLE